MAWKILTEVSNFRNLSLDQATGVEESVSHSHTNKREEKKNSHTFYLIKRQNCPYQFGNPGTDKLLEVLF
jgi:hypothetical protein